MTNNDFDASVNRPVVGIISEPSYFCLKLITNIVGNYCRIKIFTSNITDWKNLLSSNNANDFVQVSNIENINKDNIDYLIPVILTHHDFSVSKKIIQKANTLTEEFFPKVFYVTKLVSENDLEKETLNYLSKEIKKSSYFVGQILLGDLLILDSKHIEESTLTNSIHDSFVFNTIKINKSDHYYPTLADDAAKTVSEMIFSFGTTSGGTAIYSHEFIGEALYLELKRVIKNLNETFLVSSTRIISKYQEKINTQTSLRETLSWFNQFKGLTQIVPDKQIVKPLIPKINVSKTKTSKIVGPQINIPIKMGILIPTIVILFLIVIVPLIMFGSSLGLTYSGLKNLNQGNFSQSGSYFSLSRNLNSLIGQIINKIPFGGVGQLIGTIDQVSTLGSSSLKIASLANNIISGVFSDSDINLNSQSSELALEVDSIYKNASFLQGELGNYNGPFKEKIASLLVKTNFEEFRTKLVYLKDIILTLPDLLGERSSKTYLILLQNNMELRPTGGFIGSFALVTFDKGKLVAIDVQDVYSADGQLKGHIEPPTPIKEYLGEANWWLRDANWDPDFPTSATRVEWFLEKEIDKKVDGVVGIDLEFVKNLLQETGPIYLTDYNTEINSENLYEITQREVEKDFFPGSRKKSNFLSSLSKELLNSLTTVKGDKYTQITKSILKSLDERHIQIYLHNQKSQKAISQLGYDGSFIAPTCGGNCFTDYFGMVESNLGVNKVNYFIDRSTVLTYQLENELSRANTLITFKNKANQSLGLDGRYKNYLRLYIPINAKNISVKSVSPQSEDDLTFTQSINKGKLEIGILVEVMPSATKKISINWDTPNDLNFNKVGEYRNFIRKQAGIDKMPTVLKVVIPNNIKITSNKNISLTKEGSYDYNTTLTRDLFSRLSW